MHNVPLSHRNGYLQFINKAYHEDFGKIARYKEESNFKKCLAKITLDDVKLAIIRAERIMENLRNIGCRQITHKGFAYYEDNPSLSIHQIIRKILKDCRLL